MNESTVRKIVREELKKVKISGGTQAVSHSMNAKLTINHLICLNHSNGNNQKSEGIEQVSKQFRAAVIRGGSSNNLSIAWIEASLKRVVYPLTNRDQNSTGSNLYQGKVSDNFNINSQAKNHKNREEYKHSFIPIVNFQIRQRVGFHLGSFPEFLALMLCVIGICKAYRERIFYANMIFRGEATA